jgi:hypothetical protein
LFVVPSSAMEYAFEGDQLVGRRGLAASVFTSALVEGLQTGDADRDQDGLVALDELYDYVYDRVRAVTPHQTPGKWTFGVQGELVIARRARPVTTLAPLPPELQEVIDSPFAPVRVAAVQELARVLYGNHAGRALAARLALERLTDDDSRTVAAAAAEILGSFTAPPRLELSPTVVDFGRIAYGTKSPERRIRLRNAGGGSLNARSASEASWLKVRFKGDELALTVDIAQAGRHEYILTVDSDGGPGSVLVQAFVEPAGNAAPPAHVDDTSRRQAREVAKRHDDVFLPLDVDLPATPSWMTMWGSLSTGRRLCLQGNGRRCWCLCTRPPRC